jgi:sulfide dehydrogenase cytochrome subunit
MFLVKSDNNGEMEKMRRSHVISWFSSLILPLVAVAAHALTLSPGSLTLMAGGSGTISLSSVRGTASLVGNSAPAVALATLAGNKITVKALAVGTTKLTVKDGKETKTATVTVRLPMTVAPAGLSLTVGQSAMLTISNPTGAVQVSNSNAAVAGAMLSGTGVTVTGRVAGNTNLVISDSKTTVTVQVTVASVASSGDIHPGRLLASNCFQCHGTNGSSGGFDQLQGDSSVDLLEKLRKFASGDGDSIMAAHALGYTDAQLQLIADFLSKQ